VPEAKLYEKLPATVLLLFVASTAAAFFSCESPSGVPCTNSVGLGVQLIVGTIRFTVSVSTPELLPVNKLSPSVKEAVTLCEPADNVVVSTAVSDEPPDNELDPICIVPSKKVTVPAGDDALASSELGLTVALKVIGVPAFTDVAEAAKITDVAPVDTPCVTVPEVAAR
jgi:hypothetical protein